MAFCNVFRHADDGAVVYSKIYASASQAEAEIDALPSSPGWQGYEYDHSLRFQADNIFIQLVVDIEDEVVAERLALERELESEDAFYNRCEYWSRSFRDF